MTRIAAHFLCRSIELLVALCVLQLAVVIEAWARL